MQLPESYWLPTPHLHTLKLASPPPATTTRCIVQNLTKDLPNHTQQCDYPVIPKVLVFSLLKHVNYEALPSPLWPSSQTPHAKLL